MQEATKVSEHDKELWGLVTDVPRLSSIWAVICGILNVGLAGSGTILAGVIADQNSWNKTQMAVGFIQLITSVYLVGWIMSVYWSYLLINRAFKDN